MSRQNETSRVVRFCGVEEQLPPEVSRSRPALAVPTAEAQVGVFMPVYLPLDPVRVDDSRVTGGKISNNQERDMQTFLSASILAVTVNLTITETEGGGFLAVFPGDIAWPGTSSVNWFGPNQNLCNNAFVFVPDERCHQGPLRRSENALRDRPYRCVDFHAGRVQPDKPSGVPRCSESDAGCDSNSPVDPRLVS